MKTIIDLEKDNLFDFFTSMNLNEVEDFIEKYAKSEEDEMLYHKIFERCLQIRQKQIIEDEKKHGVRY
ncbi:hypothetical protein [Cetobacterium sp. ZOR0034]|uniref:hypothetical protein n=1 Tax=Cetobacterium sp. ZOR0034 TaxID=1339239 RepID=UPI000645EB31|nr:hypothetical protein [Cetobacterium sp. ZOR0034]